MSKINSNDAFAFYFSLGSKRSYQAVAEHFKVSKRWITNLAANEDWKGKIIKLEKLVREKTEAKLAESGSEINERHLQVCKLILKKAIETLRSMPLSNANDAIRAIDMVIKHERLILGLDIKKSVDDNLHIEYDVDETFL